MKLDAEFVSLPRLVTGRADAIRNHYRHNWKSEPTAIRWAAGPIADLPSDFCVLEFPPGKHQWWTYATCSMSQPADASPIEIHLHSPVQTRNHAELMTAAAHYHRTAACLGLGHTVNFGRPWLPGSRCDHGLVSLPYLDGPDLELLELDGKTIRCLWLIPITRSEVEFAKNEGLENLEKRFEISRLNYLDPKRKAVA